MLALMLPPWWKPAAGMLRLGSRLPPPPPLSPSRRARPPSVRDAFGPKALTDKLADTIESEKLSIS